MHYGLVDQSTKFKKRVASDNVSTYKVVERGQLVVGFPIDEGVLSFQAKYDEAIVSPAYGVWDVIDDSVMTRGFLQRYLKSPTAMAYYRAKLRGSTARRRSLPSEVFLALPVPLPPVHEQRRIFATLDRADELRAKRRQTLAYLDDLTQSTLQGIVQEAPRSVPLVEVGRFIRGVTFKPEDKSLPGNGNVAVMRTKNIQKRLDRSDEIYIPEALVRRREQYLEQGDTLISSANSLNLVGKACLVDNLQTPAVIGGFVTALRANNKVHPAYLFHWYVSSEVQARVRSFSSQTTNLANLNLRRCETLPIPLPEMLVQQHFAAKTSAISLWRTRQARDLEKLNELFASLQAQAFSGEQ